MAELTEAMIVTVVNEVLGSKRPRFELVEAATPLAALQLDSLDVAEIFMALEDHAGVELDPDSASAPETVGDLARMRAARHA